MYLYLVKAMDTKKEVIDSVWANDHEDARKQVEKIFRKKFRYGPSETQVSREDEI